MILRSRQLHAVAFFGVWMMACVLNPLAPAWLAQLTLLPTLGLVLWIASTSAGAPGHDLRLRGYVDFRPGDAASIVDFADSAAARVPAIKSGPRLIAKLPPRDELAITPLFVEKYAAGSVIEALRLLEEQALLGRPGPDVAATGVLKARDESSGVGEPISGGDGSRFPSRERGYSSAKADNSTGSRIVS